jgi:hypothetical protein
MPVKKKMMIKWISLFCQQTYFMRDDGPRSFSIMRSSYPEVVHEKLGRNNGWGGLRSIEVVAVSQMLRVVRETPDGLSQTVSTEDPQPIPPERTGPSCTQMECELSGLESSDVGE